MNNVQYVTEYEYATFALLMVLMGMYLTRRRLRTASNSLFLVLMVYTFISASLHMVTTKTLGHAQDFPLWFNYTIHVGYLLAYDLISVLWLVYVAALTQQNHIGKGDKIYASTIMVTDFVLLLTTPFNKLVIYFDEDMNYCHGPLFALLPALALSILVYSLILFVKHRKKLKAGQNATIIIFVVFTLSATIVQLVRPHQIIGNFAIALTLIVMFISLENPADYVDRATDCLNKEAFAIIVNNEMERKKSFIVAAFRSDEVSCLAELMGIDGNNRAIADIAKNIRTGLKVRELYYLGDWTFAVILDKKSGISADRAADIIESFFAVPINIRGMETAVTPVMCTLEYPDFVKSADDVLDTIEYTLKMTEEQSETRYKATPEALERKKREVHILAAIKQYIANNGFEVYYQPIYSVGSGSFISAEALVRMKTPELGFISPEEFIPLAEANGLISQIGEAVFRSVCDFLSSGRAAELGIRYIEVNLSPLQCVQEKLAVQFLGIMAEYAVFPEMINFEITETAGLANYEALIKNMDTLIEEGVTFSVDDYGTGFSTANYLITLPADIVKIDKSIIWPAMEDSNAFVILKKTVEMLKELGKEIVAEGAETDDMVKVLSEIGCDYLQGYFYSKPVPADDFIAFLEKASVKGQGIAKTGLRP